MDTNQQIQQPDVAAPASFAIITTGELDGEKCCGPIENSTEANSSERSLVLATETLALADLPPNELANQFASLDMAQTKKAYVDLGQEIRDKAEPFVRACRDAMEGHDILVPYLYQMQSLLSQRGEKRQKALEDAGLPTWTEWFDAFSKDIGLKVSLRTVQKKFATLREMSMGGKNNDAPRVGKSLKTVSDTTLYRSGYKAAEAEAQARHDTMTKNASTLKVRIADLEKEKEKLVNDVRQLREQQAEDKARKSSKRSLKPDDRQEFLDLATEAFEIIHGSYGQHLMGKPEGNRLVEIAKKATGLKRK